MGDPPRMNDMLRRFSIDGPSIGAAQEQAEEQDDGAVEDKMT